jgi:predicted oxidoreductase
MPGHGYRQRFWLDALGPRWTVPEFYGYDIICLLVRVRRQELALGSFCLGESAIERR